jgi:hypothetical protein
MKHLPYAHVVVGDKFVGIQVTGGCITFVGIKGEEYPARLRAKLTQRKLNKKYRKQKPGITLESVNMIWTLLVQAYMPQMSIGWPRQSMSLREADAGNVGLPRASTRIT